MWDDGFCGCKLLLVGMKMMVSVEEAPVNYVLVVVVICRGQALSGIIGRKACVGGLLSPV